jgi:hypothetical protein
MKTFFTLLLAATLSLTCIAGQPTPKGVQCKAMTKAGTQCKRKTTDASGLCWQHNPNHKSKSGSKSAK